MTYLANTLEGTNAATITTSNTAGPNQFDVVNGTGTCTFDTAHAHRGSTGLHNTFAANVAAAAKYPAYTTSIVSTANAFARLYVYFTAWPTALHNLIQFHTGAAIVGSAQINASGILRISNSAGTSVGTTTATFPLNVWTRVELDVTSIVTTTGNITARMYSGVNLESATPDSNGTTTSTGATVGGNVAQVRWGLSANATMTAAYDFWYDDVAYSDVASPGPFTTPFRPRMAMQAIAASSW